MFEALLMVLAKYTWDFYVQVCFLDAKVGLLVAWLPTIRRLLGTSAPEAEETASGTGLGGENVDRSRLN